MTTANVIFEEFLQQGVPRRISWFLYALVLHSKGSHSLMVIGSPVPPNICSLRPTLSEIFVGPLRCCSETTTKV